MKKLLAILLALVFVFAFAACSSPTTEEAPAESAAPATDDAAEEEMTEDAEPYRIAIMIKDSTTPFWRYMLHGAMLAAEDLGVEVVEYAPIQAQNLEEQVRQVEDVIQQKFDAIVIAPIDSEGIIPSIEKANEAGIPVLTANSKSGGGEIETFMGVDNYEGARTLATYMCEEVLEGEGNVVVITGNPASESSIDRQNGFTDVMDEHPGITYTLSQPGYYQRAEAMSIMENLIQSFGDEPIDAVMALNDEMALGAIQALNDAGLEGVQVSGFDGALEGLEAIQDGIMIASLDQEPIGLGYTSVENAIKAIEGEDLDEWIVVGGGLCYPDNIDELLEAYADFR